MARIYCFVDTGEDEFKTAFHEVLPRKGDFVDFMWEGRKFRAKVLNVIHRELNTWFDDETEDGKFPQVTLIVEKVIEL